MGKHWSLGVRVAVLEEILAGSRAGIIARRDGVPNEVISWWARLAGMPIRHGRHGLTVIASVDADGERGNGHGHRLTAADRVILQVGLGQGLSQRQLAVFVGVNQSSVSRELRRASVAYRSQRQYSAKIAQERARQARRRPKPSKLDGDPVLRRLVVAGLNLKLSPHQVAGRLRRKYPGRQERCVSHETIYQALYVQGAGALRHELTVTKALRSGRTSRVPRSKLPTRSKRPWLEGARITDRPAEVDSRAVPGHWEGDLVIGPDNSGIATLIERSSRFALIGRLPGARDSETVIDVLSRMIEHLPQSLRRSITWDQGSEMAQHAGFTVKSGCPVFFCDPHSPWQRGSNENLNGLVRDFYPKGTNFNTITEEELAHTQWLLNIRPRQILQWANPAEKLEQLLTSDALTT